ncbi:pantoate--beta-alanine ligase [Algoriphagus alkaliphilus]|uniref:Pantothenate synthetase n=1 Tax=Algoriphagus alkaliphilus TaxID=279824 RepID=A0A1G5YD86_9BACT|nr:pantoate--beta-alanine ligase [Algoriphagus alkaliphilus]MBA4298504.1 pantoate--beta-alanine ligase [Cyclobacterium sp.]SDA80701.1 pantoate--beta-alanine ligase [Algoriphagus alkaliphilus]
MKLIRTGAEWNPLWLNHLRNNQQIGLVPTMGALHDGHLDLVAKSRSTCDVTLVSIFVNPTQFNNPEDFQKYPKTLDLDLEKLTQAGVDYVFLPSVEEMYPAPTQLKFYFGDLEHVLEGKFRPGHFNGVGIVVSKLFHLIRPHVSFFGQKDLQQVAIIKRLVADLSFDLKLEVIPTRREVDGLAMSSRNLRLSPQERLTALLLFSSLEKAKTELLNGKSWFEIQVEIRSGFENEPFAQLEYLELIHPDSFETYTVFDSIQKSSICVAAFIGAVRLIDNMPIIS